MSVSIPSPVNPLYEFGPFRLDAAECRLQRMGEPIPLPPKVFDLLVILVNNQGKIVDKDELMSQLWPDSFVEENNLAVNISLLRKSLADGADGQKYIETIPKRGYRFIAPVTRPQSLPPNLILEREFTTSVVIEDQTADIEPRLIGSHSTESLALPALPSASERTKARTAMAVLAVATVLIVGAAVWFFFLRPGTLATLPNVKSIAVLPFKPLTVGTEDDSLGIGMADALITKLSNLDNITIRPTSAILKYDGQNQDSIAAGRALGVQAVIDGRIQRDGDKVRVTVQLLRVEDGKPIWADSFEERFTNIFKVQDAISERTARSLVSKLTAEQHQRLVRHYTENTEAYQAYIKGRYFWNKRSDDGLKKAIEYFKQAIELDPSYALAYSGMADCYSVMATSIVLLHRQDGDNPSALAKAAAQKAIEIDDTIAEAHASLAATLGGFDDQAAHREFERAIALNPSYATAYNFYALDLLGDGRLDEALANVQRAREIDPLSVIINANLGAIYFRRREYDKAEEQLKKTIEMDPGQTRAHWLVGYVYEQQGKYDQSIAEFKRALELSNNGPLALSGLGHVYAVTGRRNEALQIASQLEQMANQGRVSSYFVAMVYVGLDDKDQAFAWLTRAKQNHELTLIKIDQQLDPIRNDPRFIAITE